MVDRSKKWTVEDYLQLEEDVKCEILDGELLMTPAPLISHQRTLASLYQQLFFLHPTTASWGTFLRAS